MDVSEMTPGPANVSFDFTGQRVLVTGGGSGIGLATSRAFAAAGAEVVIIEIDSAAAEVARTTVPQVVVEAVDVTDATGLRELVSAHDGFDVVVNNAMICGDGDFLSAPPEQIRREIDVNLRRHPRPGMTTDPCSRPRARRPLAESGRPSCGSEDQECGTTTARPES